MTKAEQPVALICVFIWLGFVCAISFMEAWLKFQAPGVTIAIGLGIGRLVFSALNKVEWVFAIVVTVSAVWYRRTMPHWKNGFLTLIIIVLIAQTAWLLPALDARAELNITGQPVPPSALHWYYIAGEVIKAAALAIYGIALFKRT